MRFNPYSIITLIILIIIVWLTSSCGSIDPAKRYAKQTKEYSFEYRNKHNESFTPKSLREDERENRKNKN